MTKVTGWEPQKISDLIFQGNLQHPTRTYAPTVDITPQEVAYISHLFVVAALSNPNHGWMQYDYHEFIERHKLERHFKEEKANGD